MKDHRRKPHPPELAKHVLESVDTVAEFHEDHYRSTTRVQRGIDWTTNMLGRPSFFLILLAVIAIWCAAILIVKQDVSGGPVFIWLQGFASVTALLVSVLILATQRREDQLADRRAQLTLQLALITDKKNAKIISLLEELRRDHPEVANRVDPESEEMSQPANPKAVLAEIEDRDVRDSATPTP